MRHPATRHSARQEAETIGFGSWTVVAILFGEPLTPRACALQVGTSAFVAHAWLQSLKERAFRQIWRAIPYSFPQDSEQTIN